MTDTVKLIIEIPKERELIDKAIWYDVSDFDTEDLAIILTALKNGVPLDDVKALEQEPCDCISRQAVLNLMADYDLSMGQVVKGIHALPPVTPKPKTEWIPVSERLPVLRGKSKISEDVLITNGFETDIGYLVERKGKIFWHYYGGEYEFGIKDEDNDAIAWMPLPEPYKAESEGI